MPRQKISGIYAIRAPSGNMYIGQSVDVLRRLSQHRSDMRYGKHTNARLVQAAKKYGVDSLEYVLIEACAVEDMTAREQHWIDSSPCPYNMARTAANAMQDPEVVARLRATINTPEALARRSATAKAALSSPAVRDRMRQTRYLLNATRTEAQKAALAESGKAAWACPARRAKQSAVQKTRWAKQEVRDAQAQVAYKLWASPGYAAARNAAVRATAEKKREARAIALGLDKLSLAELREVYAKGRKGLLAAEAKNCAFVMIRSKLREAAGV